MTWNLLADEFYRQKGKVQWADRLMIIIHSIIYKVKPDILLLQEVTLDTFETDFTVLSEFYLSHIHKRHKKRSSPIGNAILYTKDFTLISSKTNTRSLHVKLKIADTTICISNVHLSAGVTTKQHERIKEITSCLAAWDTEDTVIIGGDFNDDFRDPQGIASLLSKFTPPISRVTCTARNSSYNFDHILIKGKLVAEQLPMLIDIVKNPIPNAIIPSDHLPVINKISL